MPKRALIVIDVQNDYDGGNLAVEYPVFSDSVQKVAAAMDAATANGVKVVVIKMINPPTARVFAAGTHGAEIHPEIAHRPRDHYVEKTLPSAFTGTDLELWLRKNGIDTVTIAGYMTHNCDLSTVIHAFHMGFEVEFLDDATGAVPYANSAGQATAEDIHRVMTVVFQARFAAVLSTQQWIECLQTGRMPERDDIPASNRRAIALREKELA
ncbi:cysteine hydrolase family protein [Asticcacaulis solisilvae]|uniref:cysteine hydrolase family protein n=1 Tax=Asticcacaulis solisilvae TaxID=1217274 RepID=UPI003FD7D9D1